MKPLSYLWPRSLRARLLWLVLGAVLVAQALTLYAIAVHQHSQTQMAAVNLLVTSIRTVQAAIERVEPGMRAAWIHEVSQGQWRLVTQTLPRQARLQSEHASGSSAADDPALRHSLRMMAREINRSLGRDSRVAVSAGEQPYLYVSLPGAMPRGEPGSVKQVDPNGRAQARTGGLGARQAGENGARRAVDWLQIPLDRVDPPLTQTTLIGWLASLGGLLLLAAGFSWHITRPMTALVRATEGLAAGRAEPVKPAGPIETRQLGESFNKMLASLEQSARTQRTLLAGLPHDLKGPLSRMTLRIEMADDPELKAGLKRDLDDMKRMVEQFLTYIRGQDTGSLRLESVQFDDWLNSRVADMQRLGREVALEGDLPTVRIWGDSDALDRILGNLVDNAFEHGAAPVDISLSRKGDWVTLCVKDHGQGINAHERERALEPFARLDKARTRTGNVGLGLSVVQALVIAHGGNVALGESDAGGLQVEVTLPVAKSS